VNDEHLREAGHEHPDQHERPKLGGVEIPPGEKRSRADEDERDRGGGGST
jgi:hypothetical protein